MLPNGSTLAIELVIYTGFTGSLGLPPEAVSLLRFAFIYDVPTNLGDNHQAIRF
jgi:predicted aspartyl protease